MAIDLTKYAAAGLIVLSVLLVSVGMSMAASGAPPLATVQYVDLKRYMGEWYEIARIPHRFQEGCRGSSATYSLLPNGEVQVVNRCRDEQDGALREAKGRAWVVDSGTNARLKVSFFWPFRGDYWILELGPSYEYVVVGAPNREYLWILARFPEMSAEQYQAILERTGQKGFDTSRLVRKP
jgi:apolipoprotein D and lipocalin family protein